MFSEFLPQRPTVVIIVHYDEIKTKTYAGHRSHTEMKMSKQKGKKRKKYNSVFVKYEKNHLFA